MLEELREAIREYQGQLNEVRAGLHISEPAPIPEALIQYKLLKRMGFGAQLISGGYSDQPHLWLLEWMICDHEMELFESLQQQQTQSSGGINANPSPG